MGKDIRFVVEILETWGDNSEHWETIGLYYPSRSTKFFARLNNRARPYPVDTNPVTDEILSEDGLFDKGWLPMNEFYKIKGSKWMLPDIWKKKQHPKLRVLWSYDC